MRGKLTGGLEYAFLPKKTRGETVSMAPDAAIRYR